MTVILSDNKLGKLGEEFVEKYCKKNKINYKKASKSEDMHFGIDCFIGDAFTPTDVKNTRDIFVLQILSDGMISVRHPFRETTKSTHFVFVNVSEQLNFERSEWKEFINIDLKLERDYVKDLEALWEMKKWLYKINNKHWKDFHQTLPGACLVIKKKLLQFCQEEVYLRYGSVEHSKNNQIYFKMTKEKPKETPKSSLDNIKTARERLSELTEKMKTAKPVEKKTEEEIIKIVI